MVDDNPMDAELTLRALWKHKVSNPISVARDGEEAFDHIFAAGPAARGGRLMDDIRVLYAEDDPMDRELTLHHLRRSAPDLRVRVVGTGRETLEVLTRDTFDVVLLDYRLPDVDGLQLLRDVVAAAPNVPVVMVTGHGDETIAVQALKLGALDYVVKREGYLRRLSTIIENVVAQQALADEKEALLTLNGLAVKVASTLDLDELLYQVIDAAITLLRADHSLVCRLGDDGVELIPAAWRGIPDDVAWRLKCSVGQDFLGQVAARQRAVSVRDIRLEEAVIYREPAVLNGVGGVLGAPMLARGRLLGVLTVSTTGPRTFTTVEEALLTTLAAHAAVGIENAQLLAQVKCHAAELEDRVQKRTQELASANQRLEMASRHKSQFLANMSHEFRTPLNSIMGFSDILLDPSFGPLTEKQARFVRNVQVSGQHLLTLINDLLDLSKVEAGKIELRPETFECREAIHAALSEIQPQVEQKQLELTPQMDDAPSTIVADPVRFTQILLNLLSNAVKFTPEDGRITVTARRVSSLGFQPLTPNPQPPDRDVVEIVVADTGIGIKSEDLPRLFQEFTRLDAAIARRTKGTGLGLALTKKLVELHGGTIIAASDGEGRGSTFTVRLPLTPTSHHSLQ